MAILNNLIVHGSSRFLNKAYFDILEADTGKFNKLATKVLGNDGETITVHGLMDVQGELHTKSWSNSNIATIDGSFFICPTLKVTETGSTSNGLTITQSSNTWSVQITSSSAVVTNSVYTMNSSGTVTSTGTWTIGSKVAITGEILVNNEWLPLGTLRGIITARSSDLKSVTISNITDGYSSSNNILSTIGVQNNVKHRNIKISLYEWTLSDSDTPTSAVTNPIGIYMTALGDGTGQTMIDIYGGQEPSGTTYKGLAKPYVRIGNLSGLSDLTVGGQNPKGWGIYTSNGYFEGTIAARRGYIGNNTKYWTIGTSGTNSTIFSGPTTVSATGTAGTYLGTDGFLNAASNTVYAQITNGILTAKGANIAGTITASEGQIGPWFINASSISRNANGNAAGSYNTASNMYFGISGLSLGTSFYVTSAGVLTATGGNLLTATIGNATNKITIGTGSSGHSAIYYGMTTLTSTANGFYIGTDGIALGGGKFKVTAAGAITATSLEIGQSQVTNLTTDLAGKASTTDAANAAKTATNYLTADTTNGLKVHNSGDTTDYVQVNSSAISIYRNSVERTRLEDANIRIGAIGTDKRNVYITDSSVQIRNNASVLAEYGENITLYKPGTTTSVVSITSSGATFGGALSTGTKTSSTTGNGIYIDGNGNIYAGNGSTNNFSVTSAGVLTATNAVLKTVSLQDGNGDTRAVVDGYGLTVKDASGNVASTFGAGTATIGYTSGDKYNINITGTDIDLRYNTSILNRINSSGMTLYDGNGTAESNQVASFGETVTIGKQDVAQLKMDSGSIEGVGINNLSYFKIDNTGAIDTVYSYSYKKNYGPYSVTRTSSRSVSIKTTMDLLASGSPFSIGGYRTESGTWEGNKKKYTERLDFVKGTSKTTSFTSSSLDIFSIQYDGVNTITITSTTTATRYIYITTWERTESSTYTPAYLFGSQDISDVSYGKYAFVTGVDNIASGNISHAEGFHTKARGAYSHAEGNTTISYGNCSHVSGYRTFATEYAQTVIGRCNKEYGTAPDSDAGDYAFIIGNGTSYSAADRSNALTVDWDGNINAAGSYYGVTPWAQYGAGAPNLKSVSNRTFYWVTSFSGYVAAARTNDTNVFDKVDAGLKIKRDGAYLVSLWIHFNGTASDRLYARVARCVGGDISNIGAATNSTYVTLNPSWAEVHIQQMIACLENDTLCPQVARESTSSGGSFRFGNLLMNVTYLGSNTKLVDL